MARDTTRRVKREAGTVLEALVASLRDTGKFLPGEAARPAVIVWTDEDGQWAPLIPLLKAEMPELLELGPWQPTERRGPVIWLKCAVAGVLPDVKLPADIPPVLYLQNVKRQDLGNPDGCPDELKPLIELQYRGEVWKQTNGKDWTVEAFLVSEDRGLGLDVAKDADTRMSLLQCLRAVGSATIGQLKGKHLEAEDFEKLVMGDPVRDLLHWMNDPTGTRSTWDEDRWKTFCAACKRDYGFDPKKDGELAAGELLGGKVDDWAQVWIRFAEAPRAYPNIPDLLRRAQPRGQLTFADTSPATNDKAEAELQSALTKLDRGNAGDARDALVALEKQHGPRRETVWAKLDDAPLAKIMQYLAVVAQRTAFTLGGDTPAAIADLYAREGFLADLAALRAFAGAKTKGQREAVQSALRSVYLPWLERSAEAFQEALSKYPLGSVAKPVTVETGTCVLFADGLRFDVAQTLAEKLQVRQLRVHGGRTWAALPTVTATAKPAISPVCDLLLGNELGIDFAPDMKDDEVPCNAARLREALTASGFQVLEGNSTGKPGDNAARAWTEAGELDSLGHKLGAALAERVESQLEQLAERIAGLLEAGWKCVRVVTDHGWLWLPGGLPKVELPAFLTETKWSRCATIKGKSQVNVPTAAWSWNKTQRFATAPGIGSFRASMEYAHGGLSLQECVTPVLTVEPASNIASLQATIEGVQWLRLRCRVNVNASEPGVRVDIRRKANDPTSSVAGGGKVTDGGKAALVVEDEELFSVAVLIVVLDAKGNVVARKATTVGGEE